MSSSLLRLTLPKLKLKNPLHSTRKFSAGPPPPPGPPPRTGWRAAVLPFTYAFTASISIYIYFNNNNDNYDYWRKMQSGQMDGPMFTPESGPGKGNYDDLDGVGVSQQQQIALFKDRSKK